jgi:hypothetical protein
MVLLAVLLAVVVAVVVIVAMMMGGAGVAQVGAAHPPAPRRAATSTPGVRM